MTSLNYGSDQSQSTAPFAPPNDTFPGYAAGPASPGRPARVDVPEHSPRKPRGLVAATAMLALATIGAGAFGFLTHGQLASARDESAALTKDKKALTSSLKDSKSNAAAISKQVAAAKAEADQASSHLNGMTECAADLYTAVQSIINQAGSDQIVSQVQQAMPVCDKVLSDSAASSDPASSGSAPTDNVATGDASAS